MKHYQITEDQLRDYIGLKVQRLTRLTTKESLSIPAIVRENLAQEILSLRKLLS